MICPTCGDEEKLTACEGCARRDYEGMRDMQRKYIKADHERIDLEKKLEAALLQKSEMVHPTTPTEDPHGEAPMVPRDAVERKQDIPKLNPAEQANIRPCQSCGFFHGQGQCPRGAEKRKCLHQDGYRGDVCVTCGEKFL